MSDEQKITPFLWFDSNAEEAANFYVKTFPGARIDHIQRYPDDAGSMKEGAVMTVSFTIYGMEFIGLNGGPHQTFSLATSFLITCETQSEVDDLWEKLKAAGGEPKQCGWIQDHFGVPWQIVPSGLMEIWSGDDPAGTKRAFDAMMDMEKLDINVLRAAYAGTA